MQQGPQLWKTIQKTKRNTMPEVLLWSIALSSNFLLIKVLFWNSETLIILTKHTTKLFVSIFPQSIQNKHSLRTSQLPSGVSVLSEPFYRHYNRFLKYYMLILMCRTWQLLFCSLWLSCCLVYHLMVTLLTISVSSTDNHQQICLMLSMSKFYSIPHLVHPTTA